MIAKLTANAGPGRPPTHWSEYLRASVWLQHVTSRSGLSDQQLTEEYGFETDYADGDAVFQRIRRNETIPGRSQDGTPKVVTFAEKVAQGSVFLYHHPVWGNLKQPPQTLTQSIDAVDGCLERLHIVRLHPEQYIEIARRCGLEDHLSLYNACLSEVLKRLGEFSWCGVQLLGLLCRQADMSGNMSITESTRSFYDQHVDRLLFSALPQEKADRYYDLMINDFLYSKRQSGPSEAAIRLGYESIVERPLKMAAEVLEWPKEMNRLKQ